MTDATFKSALKADAGPLPPFDESILQLKLPKRFASHAALPAHKDRTIFWLGPIALAACVALAVLLQGPTETPADVSTSLAAVARAARPHIEIAALPVQPYQQNLDALHSDTRNLLHFVGRELNVLPQE